MDVQQLGNKVLVVPYIDDFTRAQHNHEDEQGGGVVTPNWTLPSYNNNTEALSGGLVVGDFYRTGDDPDLVCVVH